jgi:cysteine desulfurase/selenocysteine lyase
MSFKIKEIRSEFQALEQTVNGHKLVYLDSAATSLKPKVVVDRLAHFYNYEAANVHRGAHFLSDRATDLYEQAREKVARFINASSSREIIFVRGTTEGINLVSTVLGTTLNPGDEILVSDIEHHANIVPWQMLAEQRKLVLKIVPATNEGYITEQALSASISPRTRILAITHASNHLGNVVDIKKLIEIAHRSKVLVVVDGAQAVGKLPVDVQSLDADFYVFSGHKMFAPFGIGVVYGKENLLKDLPPYQGGGSMIVSVKFEKTTYNDIPFRYEAGTPNVGGAVALATAIDFINQISLSEIEQYENELVAYAFDKFKTVQGLQLLGPQGGHKIPLFAFNLAGQHGSDVGFLLNQQGIAVRTGHHCTQPLLQKLNITGSIRASFSIYNSTEEIDLLVSGLNKAKDLLA